MTTKPEATPEVTETDAWEVVGSESGTKVEFDTLGDVFTGVMVRTVTIEQPNDDPFRQYLFYGWGDFSATELFAINESHKLMVLANVPEGTLTRITYVKDVPVGKGNDMKDYRVETRNLPAHQKVDYPNVKFG